MRHLCSSAVVTFLSGWLGLNAEAQAQVLINEIHYAPQDKTAPVEFVELYNAADSPADLTRWRFTDGIKFRFPDQTSIPAKGYLCIARDPEAFRKKFGTDALGPWQGKLKDSDERIRLVDATGKPTDEIAYNSVFPWPNLPDGNGPSLERISSSSSRRDAAAWRAGGPTPGKRNSVAGAEVPPLVSAVSHSPDSIKSGTAVKITARVSDPEGVLSVTLAYQVVEPGKYVRLKDKSFETEWTNVPMHDDGQNGDERANDGTFSAVLPAEIAVHRRLVRYRIAAENGKQATTTAPLGDTVPNFAFFVYDGVPAWTASLEPGKQPPITFPPALLNSLPTFHLLADQSDVEHSQWDGGWNHRKLTGTLIFDGRVYDHITFQNRGRASTYNTGKNKWGFHLAQGHELPMRDPSNRTLRKPWDSFALNACATPWIPIHRGMAGLDEWFSSHIFMLAGVPTPRHIPVGLRVISSKEEAPAGNQFAGDLWGLYMAIEDPDGSFLKERGLPDGNIYTNESGETKH